MAHSHKNQLMQGALQALVPCISPGDGVSTAPNDIRLWTIKAGARWHGSQLDLLYVVHGPIGTLVVPAPLHPHPRCDELWQHTCFEAFIAKPGEERYWELNLAPSGAWNVYQLDGYRRNLRTDRRYGPVPLFWQAETTQASLEARFTLPDELVVETRNLTIGLAVVLETGMSSLSYWALCHPGPEADFHRRDGFSLLMTREGRSDAPPQLR